MTASAALQVVRRAAVTAVAVITTDSMPAGSVWEMLTTQCWVERLVRTGRASTRKSPSDSAAAKLTVNEIGSPRRSGCCKTDCSACAAVIPPNGPTMLAYRGWVRPCQWRVDSRPCSCADTGTGVSASASSKGCRLVTLRTLLIRMLLSVMAARPRGRRAPIPECAPGAGPAQSAARRRQKKKATRRWPAFVALRRARKCPPRPGQCPRTWSPCRTSGCAGAGRAPRSRPGWRRWRPAGGPARWRHPSG